MNKTLRNGLALLLCAVILVSALPLVAAIGAESTKIFSWTASTLEKDGKVFSSNLVSNANGKSYWNEDAVMYTDKGDEKVAIHNLLNETAGRGNKVYGLPQGQTLKADIYPMVSTGTSEAIDLSFVYAYKPEGKAVNPATSGLLRVYASKNGMDWSADSVGVRSAKIVGSGFNQDGEIVIYYEIHCDNLLNIDELQSGDYLRALRIMPDGTDGNSAGTFALCNLTLAGYDSKAAFESAVPAMKAVEQQYSKVDTDKIRNDIMEAAEASQASSELGVIMDAYSAILAEKPASVLDLLNTAGIQLGGNMTDKATDSVKKIFTYMYERELMDEAVGSKILAEYETIENTQYLIREMNTPQQTFRAYASAKAGDILMQVSDTAARAYIVLESNPVFVEDGVNVDPNNSTLTYKTLNGEKTQKYFDMYAKEMLVPMTASVLVTGVAPVPQLDAHAAFGNGVHVAVVSSLGMDQVQITVGDTTVAVDEINGTAVICADKKLDEAVAALPDGKHQMTVAMNSGLSKTVTATIDFEVKDGKAVAVAPDHSAACPAKAMTDVDKNAWYHEAVDYALTNKLMGGYNATTFGPNDTLSRAMVVQVLYNKEGQPAISGKHNFTDVPADQWFNNAITWGTQKGVMGGYGDGKFGPNDNVTLEQLAVILWNYSGNPAFTGTADSVGAHSGWAANGLAWALENGILENVPFENVTVGATRAQTAQMLMNYLTAN